MKNALKAAFPTVLAVVLAWAAIEAIKWGRAKYQAELDLRKIRERQAVAAQAAAAATDDDNA